MREVEPDDDVRPSPPSIGADIPVTYFGPPPSSVHRELIGPHQLLTAGQLNEDEGTIINSFENTGQFDADRNIWHILTDTTDAGIAESLGLNHSPKLRFANVGRGSRFAQMGANNIMNFDDSLSWIVRRYAVSFRVSRRTTSRPSPCSQDRLETTSIPPSCMYSTSVSPSMLP